MEPLFETFGKYAVQKAIDKLHENGGGQVRIPAGVHQTVGLELYSNIELHLEAGAVLSFSDDPEDYPVIRTRWEGYEQDCYRPLLYAYRQQNLFVTGTGTLEGNGQRWWDLHRRNAEKAARPCFICFERCENIQLRDFRVQNSPAWTLHPLCSSNILISGVSIVNPYDSPNTDGIDPESCRNVRIIGCYVDVGDDCIAIKAGTEDADEQFPCENIVITGCTMNHGHGGVVLGSEMSGSIRHVTVSSCIFNGTDRGIRIKTRRRRGGSLDGMTVTGVMMNDVICPIVVNMMYYCGKDGHEPFVADPNPQPVDAGTPSVRHILISDIQVSGCKSAAVCLYGIPESPIEHVQLSNVHIEMVDGEPAIPVMCAGSFPMNRAGVYAEHCRGLDLSGLVMTGVRGPEKQFVNVEEV